MIRSRALISRGTCRGAARGWTLLELMAGIAVMTILSAMAVTSYRSYLERARNAEAVANVLKIEVAVKQYDLQNGRQPDSLADIGLGALRDPWGQPFQYLNLQGPDGTKFARRDHNLHPLNSDFDLYSKGPDMLSKLPLTASQSRDDLIRANDGRYIGKAADY